MYTEMVKRFDELFKQNIEIMEELAKLSAKEVALEIKSVADDLGWEIEIKRESISMYNKMKTDGKPKYVDGVISQVERTLRTLNKAIQDLRVEKLLAEKKFAEANEELDILKHHVEIMKRELRQANMEIERLSTSENIVNANIQFELDKLQALENAGVDNWVGYDYAMDELMRGKE